MRTQVFVVNYGMLGKSLIETYLDLKHGTTTRRVFFEFLEEVDTPAIVLDAKSVYFRMLVPSDQVPSRLTSQYLADHVDSVISINCTPYRNHLRKIFIDNNGIGFTMEELGRILDTNNLVLIAAMSRGWLGFRSIGKRGVAVVTLNLDAMRAADGLA